MRLFKRTHKCRDFKWGEPYMENWTKKVYKDAWDYYTLFDEPEIVKFKALGQRGTCTECGLVKIRRV